MISVLLVYPWIYDFAAYDLWLKPLGFLYIASILREYGARVILLDCLYRHHRSLPYVRRMSSRERYGCGKFYSQVIEKPEILAKFPRKYKRYGLPLSNFVEQLEQMPEPDAILVSSGMTYWYPGVFDAIAILKQKFPQIPIILGGIYATLCYDHAVENSKADYVVKGPNINELIEILEKITGHTLGKVSPNPSDYPYPAYDLYEKNDYIAIRTSFGCPFNCTYCAVGLMQKSFFQRSPESVVKEIEYFSKNLSVSNFAFYDDALLFDAENHIVPILESLLKLGLNCYFHTPNGLQARFLTPKVARIMRRAGFVNPRLSLETSEAKRQSFTGGKVTNEEMQRAVAYLKEAGYDGKEIGIYVMMGLPEQPFDEVDKTIDFVHRLGAKIILVEYSPIPGTEEWKRTGLDDKLDPLLHNNSLFPLYRVEDWPQFQRLKARALALNNTL